LVIGALALACTASAQDEGRAEALRLGQPFERELRGGQAHAYFIEVAAGQYLQVSVEQLGLDVRAVMSMPGGRKWAEAERLIAKAIVDLVRELHTLPVEKLDALRN
jgi:hypothetical protein